MSLFGNAVSQMVEAQNYSVRDASSQVSLAKAELTFKKFCIDTFAAGTTVEIANIAIEDLRAALTSESEARAQLRALNVQAEDAKSMVLIGGVIDGKNEAIRAAQLLAALKDSPEYQAAQSQIATTEATIADASNRVRVAQARLEVAKALLRQGTAALELLAK